MDYIEKLSQTGQVHRANFGLQNTLTSGFGIETGGSTGSAMNSDRTLNKKSISHGRLPPLKGNESRMMDTQNISTIPMETGIPEHMIHTRFDNSDMIQSLLRNSNEP